PEKLKEVLPEVRLFQQRCYLKRLGRLGDINLRPEFVVEMCRLRESDQRDSILDGRVRESQRNLDLADAPSCNRVYVYMRGKVDREPVRQIILRLFPQSPLGTELRAPPVVNRCTIESRVFRNPVVFQLLKKDGEPCRPRPIECYRINPRDLD